MEAPRSAVLIGFMAAGKSTVGRRLAEKLGWRHLDLDRLVEEEAGESVATLFATRGEAVFRALETAATRRVAGLGEVILSTGGGWVLNPLHLDLLPPSTPVYWLDVPAREIVRRIRAGSPGAERPLLRGLDPEAAVPRMLAAREPLYRTAGTRVPTAGRSIEDIADELAGRVRAAAFASKQS